MLLIHVYLIGVYLVGARISRAVHISGVDLTGRAQLMGACIS
jgi:hypothetical protein